MIQDPVSSALSDVICHFPFANSSARRILCYLKPAFQTTSPLDSCPIIFIPCSKSNFLTVDSIVYGLPRIAQAFAIWSVSSRLRMPLLLSPWRSTRSIISVFVGLYGLTPNYSTLFMFLQVPVLWFYYSLKQFWFRRLFFTVQAVPLTTVDCHIKTHGSSGPIFGSDLSSDL